MWHLAVRKDSEPGPAAQLRGKLENYILTSYLGPRTNVNLFKCYGVN